MINAQINKFITESHITEKGHCYIYNCSTILYMGTV